jgi:hypothetical protein
MDAPRVGHSEQSADSTGPGGGEPRGGCNSYRIEPGRWLIALLPEDTSPELTSTFSSLGEPGIGPRHLVGVP